MPPRTSRRLGLRAASVGIAVALPAIVVILLSSRGNTTARQHPTSAGPSSAAPAEATPTDPPLPATFVAPPPADAARGLTARNLLLLVNRNEPAGQRLAAFYAAQRGVPDGRIVPLDLPTGDEVPFDDYDAKVVPAVRTFLSGHRLADEVTCLVTFYGVPLRVGPRANTPAEAGEYRRVAADLRRATESVREATTAVEDLAKQADAAFRPAGPPADDLRGLVARADAAVAAALPALAADPDAARRDERFARLSAAVEAMYGSPEAVRRSDLPAYRAAAGRPPPPDRVAAAATRAATAAEALSPLLAASARSADARAKARLAVADHWGALGYARVLTEHKLYLETAETESAVDSELACLWWPDDRPRCRWADNPLRHPAPVGGPPQIGGPGRPQRPWGVSVGNPARPAAANGTHGPDDAAGPGGSAAAAPRTLMVTRIDGPSERAAHDLIATSVRVEAAGLHGGVALDARGKPPTDPYGRFDESIRALAADLAARPGVAVTLDDRDAVFPPGAVNGVALYCGWYSLRHYVPGATFVPGAVGYHVASLELVGLHDPRETGWVRGLLGDGVVATVGAVAEPYLHAFPVPTEFFPLLATGRPTLAEVYWRTTPLVSWMTTCVGDPLYRPYAANPLVDPGSLPPELRAAAGPNR